MGWKATYVGGEWRNMSQISRPIAYISKKNVTFAKFLKTLTVN